MNKKNSTSSFVPTRLAILCSALLIAGSIGCSQERYEDSKWDEGTSSSASTESGTTLPSGAGTTLPSARGTTLPSGRGTTLPAGRGTTLPSGRGTTLPSGRGTTLPR